MSTIESPTRSWEDAAALVLGAFLLFAGVTHFTNPDFFNEIVPPWLPPSEEFWTYLSGVAEIIVAVMIFRRSTRRAGAHAAVWLFVAVYPANLYMVWDWRSRSIAEQLVSYVRLPFQFLFIWVAWRIASRAHRDELRMPGDVVAGGYNNR
ncbi:MAG: MauE/DoxX family redox-associated membrane protein [Ilumatobacteraceae bacterium]|jgi:uncharacterized membrane protein